MVLFRLAIMYFQLPNALLLFLGAAATVTACDLHQHMQLSIPIDTLSRSHVRRQDLGELFDRRAESAPRDWEYRNSAKWGDIKPGTSTPTLHRLEDQPHIAAYKTCSNGTQQSPIDLLSSYGLAKTHKPTFVNYDRNVTGDLYNWGFGPSFTLYTEGGLTSLPALKYDDKPVYLIGFHLHFPAEHKINGRRHKAELHLVHADAKGKPAAVLGILIDMGAESYSFSTVPPVPGPDDKTVVKDVALNVYLDIQEAGYFKDYWTYEGSLTTPPCDEGLRWFVSKDVQTVSRAQWRGLLDLNGRRYSARVTQDVKNQRVNL